MRITQERCLLLILSYLQPLNAAPPHQVGIAQVEHMKQPSHSPCILQTLARALPEVWRVNLPNLSSTTWRLPSGAATRQWSGQPNYKLDVSPIVHPGKKQPIDRSVSFDNSKMSPELLKMIQESSRLRHQDSGVLRV